MMMRSASSGLAVGGAVAVALMGLPAVAVSSAANSKRHSIRPTGGTYKGTVPAGVMKSVVMKVTNNGTRADAQLVCIGQSYGHIVMKITKGAFAGRHQLAPGVQVWTLSGHFASKTTAVAHYGGGGVCDGKSGNVKLILG